MTQKSSKQGSQKEVRKDAFLKLGMIFLVILIIANTIQIARFGEIVERVDSYNKGVVDELGGFRQDIISFGSDMNEMRSFLLLPTKDYSFIDKETEIEEETTKEASETEKALYQFLGGYTDEKLAEKNFEEAKQKIESLNSDEAVKEKLEEAELSLGRVEAGDESASFKVLAGSNALYEIIGDKKGSLQIRSILGSQSLSEDKTSEDLISYVTTNKEQVIEMKEKLETKKSEIVTIQNNQEVKKIISEKNVAWNEQPEEDEEGFHYSVTNSEGTVLLTISLTRSDATYSFKDQTYDSADQVTSKVIDALKEIDSSTALEKMVAERRAELESIFQDEAFQDLLQTNGLTVEPQPREEYNKVLYDVKNADGNVEFSFVIELSSGLFKVLKDNEEIDLYTILQGSKKKP